MQSMLVGYGIALLAPVVLLDAGFRREIWKRFVLVPVVLLAAWTVVLSQNSRFGLDVKLMPMHFTRGYLHAALWITLIAWLQYRMSKGAGPRSVAMVGVMLAVVVLPDTALFLEDQYKTMPHRSSLVWGATWEEVHARLRSESEPQRVLVESWEMGRQICALHQHRSAFGTPLTTPHYRDRQSQLDQYRRDPDHEPEVVRWATRIIVSTRDAELDAAVRDDRAWDFVFGNSDWRMYERVRR